MVMFFEDDERIKKQIKEEQEAKRGPVQKIFRRVIKIGFVVFGLCVAIFFGLSVLGSQKSLLKPSLESVLSSSIGHKVTIGSLDHTQIVPRIAISASDILIQDASGVTELGSIKTIEFSMSFWGAFLPDYKIHRLFAEDVKLSSAITGGYALQIEKLAPSETDPVTALEVLGKYGGDDLELKIIRKEDTVEKPYLRPSHVEELNASIGDVSAIIEVGKHTDGSTFRIKKLGTDEAFLTGSGFYAPAQVAWIMEIISPESKAPLKIELALSDVIQTAVKAKTLNVEDIPLILGVIDQLGRIGEYPRQDNVSEPYDFEGIDFELGIDIAEIHTSSQNLGSLNANITIKDNILSLNSAQGDFVDGRYDAKLTYDLVKDGEMVFEGKIDDWNYASLQHILQGTKKGEALANTKFSLSAKGKTDKELIKTLAGDFTLVAGQGKMPSKALNIWGAGLINALMPSLDAESETVLNCVIANFEIKDGVAVPSALFLDTKRVTAVAEGEINFVEDKIDLTISPNAKETAFLDVAPAVDIEGRILEPKISVNNVSLITKIGGVALGFVNPAFLAFSMTDLGVSEDHPCREFLGGAPEEEQKEKNPKSEIEEKPKTGGNE